MNKYFIFSVVFILHSFFIFSESKKIPTQEFKQFIEYEINNIRERENLELLNFDEDLRPVLNKLKILSGNKLVSKSGAITTKKEQENVFEEEKYNASKFYERSLILNYSKRKIRIPHSSRRFIVNSYDSLMSFFSYYLNNDVNLKIIKDEQIVNMYFDIQYNSKTKKIKIMMLFTSEPFENRNSYEIKFKKNIKNNCYELKKKYSYFPWLLTENITVKNKRIKFNFKDTTLIKEVFLDLKKDFYLTVDLIHKDQFECNKSLSKNLSDNVLGKLYKPTSFSKGKITRAGIYQLIIGNIPKRYHSKDVEFNILITKKNAICFLIKPVKIKAKNISYVPKFFIDTTSITYKTSKYKKVILPFKFFFKENHLDIYPKDVQKFIKQLDKYKNNIKSAKIVAYSAITEFDNNLLKELQTERAKQVSDILKENLVDSEKIKIVSKPNWKFFCEDIEGYLYQKFIESKSKKQIIELVKKKSLELHGVPSLKNHEYCQVELEINELDLKPNNSKKDYYFNHYKSALKEFDENKALYYQGKLIALVDKDTTVLDSIGNLVIRHLWQNITLVNNKIVLLYKYKKINKSEFEKYMNIQLFIDPKNPYLNYNMLSLALLDIKEKNEFNKYSVKEIKQLINTLYDSKLPKKWIDYLMFSYNIILADYYYNISNNIKRTRQINVIKQFIFSKIKELDKQDIIKYTRYFAYQLKFESALDFLLLYLDNKHLSEVDEDLLFEFLPFTLFFEKKVTDVKKVEYFRKAKNKNSVRFCKLFEDKILNYQVLENEQIRKIYCKACNE